MKKHLNSINILSILYSFFLLFGTSYLTTGSAQAILDSFVICIIIYIMLFITFKKLLTYIYKLLDTKIIKKDLKVKNNNINLHLNRFRKKFEAKPFLVSLIIILIMWIPYVIAFYPAILSPDPSYQIRQYFGIPNKYSDYAIMLDENVTITNHHPVVHTLLLGTSLKIGTLIGNDNFGLFIYSIIQLLTLASVLSYTIKYMSQKGVSYNIRIISLILYCFIPMYPLYAMSAVKDVIYTSLMILYVIFMYDTIKCKDKMSINKIISIIILSILLILFRNNGYYVLLLTMPFLFVNKKNIKQILIVYITVISFNYTYNKIVLPYFKITPSSVREMLSIPFQQTARYVKAGNKLEDEEYEIYDLILDMSDLKDRYDPSISDPVKNKFNKYTTNEDLKIYFNYWFKGLFKDPLTYIEATINNVYGYFYPAPINWYIYYKFDDRIVENGFNYHYNSFNVLRNILSGAGKYFIYIPILGLISTIGFNTWLIFFMIGYLIHRKKHKCIIYLTPALVTLLICIASPVNAYFRYAMPYIFSMPIMIGLFFKEVENEKR